MTPKPLVSLTSHVEACSVRLKRHRPTDKPSCHHFASALASCASERRSANQKGNYGHEDLIIDLLASEKAFSTRVWVSPPSFLTHSISCLASLAPVVYLGSVVSSMYSLCFGRSIHVLKP